MKRRSRLLRIAKWAGVGACGLVIAVWTQSVRFPAWTIRDGMMVATAAGCAGVSFHRVNGDPNEVARTAPFFDQLFNQDWTIQRRLDWRRLSSYGFSLPTMRKSDCAKEFLGSGCLGRGPPPPGLIWTSIDVTLPYWSILTAISLPTVLACRRDRRPIPGHCPCGYNLTGNVSGTCPECGSEAKP